MENDHLGTASPHKFIVTTEIIQRTAPSHIVAILVHGVACHRPLSQGKMLAWGYRESGISLWRPTRKSPKSPMKPEKRSKSNGIIHISRVSGK